MASALDGSLRRVDAALFAPDDPRRLAAVRIGLFTTLAVRLTVNDYAFVAGQPAALFEPVSYMQLLDRMPGEGVVWAAQLVGITAALLAAAGIGTRASMPTAFACALLLNGMWTSTGKIMHNDVLLTLCLIPLLLSPRAAAAAWSLPIGRSRSRRSVPPPGAAFGWPVRTAMVVIALAYLFVGLQKLRFGGIEWITSENLRWALYAASDAASEPNPLALFAADRVWLTHLLAAGTIAIEVGFPLALIWPRLRWIFVPGVVSLHLGILLAMGLDYSAQVATVLVVFVNWPVVVARLRRVAERAPPREPAEGLGR